MGRTDEEKQILVRREYTKNQLTGLEYWFETKANKKTAWPPKWKMAIITLAVIFILTNTLIPFVGDLFRPLGWHRLITGLLSVIVMVMLMTYLVMPFITKLLSRWLFKQENK